MVVRFGLLGSVGGLSGVYFAGRFGEFTGSLVWGYFC